jgi:uncharacterized protein
VIVVSDTSPLVYLAAVGQAELLSKLYGRVVAPMTVRTEIAAGIAAMPANRVLLECQWLEFQPARNVGHVAQLAAEVDEGEAEAIELALELKADLVLMDDQEGRAVAQREGLRVVGLLGVLVDAKRAGHLGLVRPVLEKLNAETNFRLTPTLQALALKAAGE